MNRGLLLAIPVLAASLCLVPGTALPAQEYSNYIALKGGYYGPQDELDNADFDSDRYFELALGNQGRIFGFELSAGIHKTETPLVEVTNYPVLITLKAGIPVAFLFPYAEAGIGGHFTSVDATGGGSDDDFSFGWHLGAGADLRFGRFFVGAEARYLWIEPTVDLGGGDIDVKLEGITVTGNVGVRF